MDLLLDTHIWLWSVGQSKRLAPRVARELTSSSNQLWLSPISVWEVHLLHRKQRITVEGSFEEWIKKTLEKVQFKEATLTIDVAMELCKVVLPHADPGDRFLAATARVFGLTLVTADEHLINAPGIRVLANR